MTKILTVLFTLAILVFIGCGNDERKQLTGITKPSADTNTLENEDTELNKLLSEKNALNETSLIFSLIESGEINKSSTLDNSDQSLIMFAKSSESRAYTGFIIKDFENNPATGVIQTLSFEKKENEEKTEVNIINGKGEIYQFTITPEQQTTLETEDFIIRLSINISCLIVKNKLTTDTAVVCQAEQETSREVVGNVGTKEENESATPTEETIEQRNQ